MRIAFSFVRFVSADKLRWSTRELYLVFPVRTTQEGDGWYGSVLHEPCYLYFSSARSPASVHTIFWFGVVCILLLRSSADEGTGRAYDEVSKGYFVAENASPFPQQG